MSFSCKIYMILIPKKRICFFFRDNEVSYRFYKEKHTTHMKSGYKKFDFRYILYDLGFHSYFKICAFIEDLV